MPLSRRVLVMAVLGTIFFGAQAQPSNKWRIEVSSDADSDGVLVFQVLPTGRRPVDVTVHIPQDAGENHVARLIRDSMSVQLGRGYAVEVDDGEDVLVKRRGDTPDFDLILKEMSVTGLRIELDRE